MLVVFGIMIGGLGAVWAGRAAESLLYGLRSADPFAYLSAAGVLASVAAVAAAFPARKAASIDPMLALRHE
jgi:ABC-type antimicrobial peptide transport system permease subunit